MENIHEIYPAARKYASEHAQQCAQEIVTWRETAIYQGSALRELADILMPIDSARAMQMAEDLVIEVALVKLASDRQPK